MKTITDDLENIDLISRERYSVLMQIMRTMTYKLKNKYPNLIIENEVKLINDKKSKFSNNERKNILLVNKWKHWINQ